MKRSTKILLGVATIWPIIYIFLFIAVIFGFIAYSSNLPPNMAIGPSEFAFFAIFVLHFFTILLSLGLTVFYIIHAIKNESLESNMKAMWAVLFFFAGMIAQTIYWYLNIWKGPDEPGPPGLLGSANTSTWDFQSQRVRQGEYQPPNEPPDWR